MLHEQMKEEMQTKVVIARIVKVVHHKMKVCRKCAHPQLRCDEFVSSSEQNGRNVHQLLSSGSSAVNGCRQNESPNG